MNAEGGKWRRDAKDVRDTIDNGGFGRTFSCVLSACQALIIDTMTENTQGGADMSKVGTYAKPSVPVKVG